ncbi:hypothetical protein HOLleu_05721 [Holothuria leucospilota]|uniref:Septin-type G domain-containing protein n=1 Tax=Holothuria leucospilota TaxID=206669 RepID=A0A9Q1HHL4_HOLLE|nr:hypothetical protein HOLleu_05721 [Holothuria leucospilota]
MARNLWFNEKLSSGGNPSIYLLQVSSETILNEAKKTRKCYFGPEIGHLEEKVIMFVGETGSGKTTMINTIVNYLLGTEWKDDKRYKLIADREEEEEESQTTSKTMWISSYIFHQKMTKLSYKVTLVDTPGFGDEKDNLLPGQIKDFFGVDGEGGIDHIDAVALVVKASSVRLTPAQKRIFDSVLSLFGEDIRDNIFLFITNAEATQLNNNEAPVIQAAEANNIPVRGICVCNNIVLFYQKDNRGTKLANSTNMHYEVIWDSMRENIKTFFDELDTCTPKSLTLSANVLAERRNLEITVAGLPGLIKSSILEMNTLREEEKVLERYREDVQTNCNFSYEVNEEVVFETTLHDGREATVCNLCRRTCHFPCRRDMYIEVMGLRMCAAMRYFPEFRGCGVCLNHCNVRDHTLGPMRYDRKIVKVTKTKQEMKQRYEIAKENMNNAEAYVRVCKTKQREAQQAIEKCVERLRECVKRLDEIALRSDPNALVKQLWLLKEHEIHCMEPGWEDRVKELDKILRDEKPNMVIKEETQAEEREETEIGQSSVIAVPSTVSYPIDFFKWIWGPRNKDGNTVNN